MKLAVHPSTLPEAFDALKEAEGKHARLVGRGERKAGEIEAAARELELARETYTALAGAVDAAISGAVESAVSAEDEWGKATKRCFETYRSAGELLTTRKKSMRHGQWLPWIKLHMPQRYREKDGGGVAAWQRTAQNWMRIYYILTNCRPELVERAQTVAQLFRLAQMLPEGSCEAGSIEAGVVAPAQVVGRIHRWITSAAPMLSVATVRTWPAAEREQLRQELQPLVELAASLD